MKRHVGVALAFALFLVAVSGSQADAGKPRQAALPDLTISAISAPSSTSPGKTIAVSSSIRNQGKVTSVAFSMSYYLSTTKSKTSTSPLLSVQNVGSLSAGTSVTVVTSLAIPSTTSTGTFYVVGLADSNAVVKKSNEANNSTSSGVISVKDSTPPTISAVTSSGLTASSATITWTTNEASTSQVEYGMTTAYGSVTALATSLVTNHSLTLSGLTAGSTYHFRVHSKDSAGNAALSGEFTFTTASPAASAITGPTYFVAPNGTDNADGSAAHPWATIQHAADNVGPGTTVHVAPGDYPGAIVSRTSGTVAAPIRFVSDTPWEAKIRSTGAQYTWENYGDYLEIVGFDVSGDARIGILNWASNVRIIGNHVHDIPATGCTSNGGAGIDHANYSAHDNDTIGNVVHDIGDIATVCDAVHGIYHSNLRGHILNNISFRNQGWGIHLYHAPMNVVVANNLSFANGKGGIVVGSPAGGPYTADGMLVSNNIVIYNKVYGIKEAEQTGTNNQHLNNLVYGNIEDDWHINGSFAIPPTNIAADPQLVNYQPDGSGDYHLTLQSPAIDVGTSVGAPSDDFDGGPRPQGTGWDIGPYEWRLQ